MAYRNRNRVGGTAMTKALGQMVGLLLVLYVFDRLIDAIWTVVNASVWFSDAVALIQTLLPVLGILGAFEVVWNALKATGLV